MARKILFTSLLVLIVPSLVFAAEPSVVQLNAKGTVSTITLPENYSSPVTAYVLSKGNETQYVSFRVQAPLGTKVTAKSVFLGNNKPAALLAKKTGWLTTNFVDTDGNESATLAIGTAPKSLAATSSSTRSTPVKLAASSGGIYCGAFSIKDLDNIVASLASSAIPYTRNELCSLYGYAPGTAYVPDSNTPVNGGVPTFSGTDGDNGTYNPYVPGYQTTITTNILVHKDTCGVPPSGTYLVKVEFNFAGIPADQRAQADELLVSALPIPYGGSKASSLKPKSDGKFAPKALFLMASTGGYYGNSEKLNIVKWNKGVPSFKTQQVEDMVYWRGHQLARALAEPHMKGGKGVVQIQSKVGTYSVCFTMSKSRQKYNGYS